MLEQLEDRTMLDAGLDGTMPIGQNFEFIKDYSPAWVFTDAFLESRTWVSESFDTVTHVLTQDSTPVSVDQYGWPTQLATGTNSLGHPTQQQLQTDMFQGLGGGYAGGVYYAQWDGSATIVWSGDLVVTQTGTNAGGHNYALLNVTPGNQGIHLNISNMTVPITNLHVWMPDYNGQSFVGQVWSPGASFSPFHPLFLQRLAGFSPLRFIHWELGVSSQEVHWSDVRPYNYARQGTFAGDFQRGMAPEYMIELANELHADAWFTMPAMAAPDYLQGFATLVRNTLDPKLKIYVEWSDEAWNPTFGYLANTYIQQQMAMPQYSGMSFYQVDAIEVAQTMDNWTQVFAGQTSRLIRVASGQAGNTYVATQLLQYLNGDFDALSIAPYMDMLQSQLQQFNANTTVDDVFNQLYDVSLPDALAEVDAHEALAAQYSASLGRHISLIAYEGGASLIPGNTPFAQAFYNAGVDPRMYDLYYQYLRALPAHGLELFVNFCFTGEPYQQPAIGDFGALHAMDQPTASAPKFQALEDAVSGLVFYPQLSIAAPVSTASENGPTPGSWQITRTGDLSQPLAVSFTVGGNDPLVDYTGIPSTITMPANQKTLTINLTPTVQNLVIGDRTVTLNIQAATGYSVLSTGTSATITITGSNNTIYYTLPIQNPSFETGDFTGWTLSPITSNTTAVASATSGASSTGAPATAHGSGTYFVWGAGASGMVQGGTSPEGVAQTIDVSSQAAAIDAGIAQFTYTGWGAGISGGTQSAFIDAQFLDGGGNALGSRLVSNSVSGTGWQQMQIAASVPAGTRSVQLRAMTQRPANFTANRAGFDDLSAELQYNVATTVSIQATTPNALEARLQPATLTLTRSSVNSSNPMLVSYTLSGSGTAGANYAALPGYAIIPAGAASTTIHVAPLNNPADLNNETVTVTLAGSTAYAISNTGTAATATIIATPPEVTGVYASGTAWTASMLNAIDSSGQGDPSVPGLGFRLADGSNQLTTTLPWSNVNLLNVAFNMGVSVSQSSLTLYNSSGAVVPSTRFTYNAQTHVGQWTFATLPADKYWISLASAAVSNAAAAALDGDWTTSTSTFAVGSGDGLPGGDFNFRFNVLPGDVKSSGSVTNGAVLLVKLNVGAVGTALRDDINGSGAVTNGDVLMAKLQVGSNLSSFTEPVLPPSTPAPALANPTVAAPDPSSTITTSDIVAEASQASVPSSSATSDATSVRAQPAESATSPAVIVSAAATVIAPAESAPGVSAASPAQVAAAMIPLPPPRTAPVAAPAHSSAATVLSRTNAVAIPVLLAAPAVLGPAKTQPRLFLVDSRPSASASDSWQLPMPAGQTNSHARRASAAARPKDIALASISHWQPLALPISR